MTRILLFISCVLATLLACSCRNDKPIREGSMQDSASTQAQIDSAMADSLATPPQAADGLFDDFIYAFMRNRKFQLERTDFPLTYLIDETNHPIAKSQWKHDRLYSQSGTYTLIFDSEKDISAEKDTALKHVVVEWVYLSQKRVKQYHFDKSNGQWRLTRIEQHDLSKNINSDFYTFYARFATDKAFQRRHILDPFQFKTHDFDNFQTIEGVLDVDQWPDYRPKLPQGTITNINYGQHYGNRRTRVLMICSPSGGMGCALTFIRKGNTWMLKKLEN